MWWLYLELVDERSEYKVEWAKSSEFKAATIFDNGAVKMKGRKSGIVNLHSYKLAVI